MSKKFVFGCLPKIGFKPRNHKMLSSEQVMKDGRVISRSCYVLDDLDHRYDGISSDDFLLENQLANGVDLKQVAPISMLSPIEMAESISSGLSYVLVHQSKVDVQDSTVVSSENVKPSENGN